jgi:glycosyltransferase involved in cell wall biosynthesis
MNVNSDIIASVQDVRPRAALNAQLLRLNEGYRSAGIARYIFHLLRQLPQAAPDFVFDVFTTEPLAPTYLQNVNIRTTRLPVHKPLWRILWEQTLFAWALRDNYALLHSLAYVSPLLNRTPSIVTLYDLSFYLYPEYFRPFHRLYLQIGTRATVRRARKILTISESSKQDVVRLLQVSPARVQVVTPGVEQDFFRTVTSAELETFRRAKKLPEHFVLFLGTREPRKNLPTLIRAFVAAKRAAKLPHYLILAGGRGWWDHEIERTIHQLGVTEQILFPGFVEQAELPLWYRAADAFVYPSQYEGFGMPALEALACGTPVIASNISSLPEAVGDAGLLVNPRAPDEIANALLAILTDATLRDELAARGPQHARQFSWARAAQLTAETYRQALNLSGAVTTLHPITL